MPVKINGVQSFVYRKPMDGRISITMTKICDKAEVRLLLKESASIEDAFKIVDSIKLLAENDSLDNAMRDFLESTRN